jgi:hypothetical protein
VSAHAKGPGPPPLSARAATVVIGTWQFRTRAERESTLRFRRLAAELTQTGAEKVVIDLARRGAHDEFRHAQLCAAVTRLYGGVPDQDSEVRAQPVGAPGLGQRDRVLYEVVAFCCIAETINAQLLTTILHHASAPRVVRVVRRLVKDEIVHSRLGWAHLAAERSRGRGAFLPPLLPRMLEASVDPEIFSIADEPVDAAARAHGELPRVERVAIFVSALRDVIFPGFESFGLATDQGKAWLEHQLAGSE